MVAPFTGAWIEIRILPLLVSTRLKVAPFTGAWIEMMTLSAEDNPILGRSLHGSVD